MPPFLLRSRESIRRGEQSIPANGLELYDVARLLLAVLTLGYLEGDTSALIERLVAVHLDFREMHEQIFPVFLRNESVTLLSIEPLDSSFSHLGLFPFPVQGS